MKRSRRSFVKAGLTTGSALLPAGATAQPPGAPSPRTAGVGDFGTLTMTELIEFAGRMAGVVDIPVVGDADGGGGNPLNVHRTIRPRDAPSREERGLSRSRRESTREHREHDENRGCLQKGAAPHSSDAQLVTA